MKALRTCDIYVDRDSVRLEIPKNFQVMQKLLKSFLGIDIYYVRPAYKGGSG